MLLWLLLSLLFLSTLLYAGGVPKGVCDDGVGLFTFMMMMVISNDDDDGDEDDYDDEDHL